MKNPIGACFLPRQKPSPRWHENFHILRPAAIAANVHFSLYPDVRSGNAAPFWRTSSTVHLSAIAILQNIWTGSGSEPFWMIPQIRPGNRYSCNPISAAAKNDWHRSWLRGLPFVFPRRHCCWWSGNYRALCPQYPATRNRCLNARQLHRSSPVPFWIDIGSYRFGE